MIPETVPPTGHRSANLALGAVALLAAGVVVPPYSGATWFLLVAAAAAFLTLHARGRRFGVRAVAICGAALLTAAALSPPRFSRDVIAYGAYGSLVARHHLSPYRAVPADFPGDVWTQRMNPSFRSTHSVYGPLWAAISAAEVALGGTSLLATRLFFQLLAAIAVAAAGVLLWRETHDPMAVAWVAINPLVADSVVNGGHNDALVGLAILGAVLLLRRRRPAAAGAVLALGSLVKVVALLPAAALALWLWRRRDPRSALALSGTAAAIVVAGYAVAGGGVALAPLREISTLVSHPSFWRAVLDGLGVSVAGVRALAAAAVGILSVALVLPRLRRPHPGQTAAAPLVAYVLAAAYVLPWYAMWALPALALHRRSRLALVTLGYSCLLLAAYFPLSSHVWPVVGTMRGAAVQVIRPLGLVAILALVLPSAFRSDDWP